VQFSGGGSTDPENGALSYQWDFGVPGANSNLLDAHYTFTKPGIYTVVLTVQDDFGNIADTAIDITVTAANHAPSVRPYTTTAPQGPAPLNVSFVANASDPDGDVLSYYWDFGDGFNSSEENPTHSFTQPGSYTVSVEVSDGALTSSAQLYVSVESALTIEVSEAEMDWERHGGKLKLGIYFNYGAQLIPNDVIRVSFGNLVLLKTPLVSFDMREPGVYVYKNRHVYAKLDLNRGYLKISRRLRSGKNVQSGQAVPVMLGIGSVMGTDQITLNAEDRKTGHRGDHHRHASFCKQRPQRR
jgi:PKD repeat protein